MISESEGEMVANEATNENLKDRHFKMTDYEIILRNVIFLIFCRLYVYRELSLPKYSKGD